MAACVLVSARVAAPFDSGVVLLAHGGPQPRIANGRVEPHIVSVAWAAALPVGAAAQAQPVAYRGDWTADSRQTWRGDDGEARVQFNLRSNAGDNRWGFGVRIRDLTGLPSSALSSTADNIQFTWTREAGAFRFKGSFDQGRGSGTDTFAADPAFITNMGAAGYRNLSTDDLVRFAVIDVTPAHVRGLGQAGYANLSIDDVVRTRIHQVTPEFVRDLAALGYRGIAVDDLVRMGIHGATPANIKSLQDAGIRGHSVEDLIRFRIHKVTPEYIRGMRDVGFVTVSEEQLVRMKIHKVDAQFIRDARADVLSVQTPGDAVDLAIHGRLWRKRG